MSKFSVRKPFTVLVGVVVVLVLGFVAFTRMTPDLLPNMNLPYILVITIYPGATPEKVETAVTKPLEQTMATLEGIKSVGSTSGENSSMLMLEFENDVNMDTITVDILQKISSVEEYWDDTVTTPMILKMNPDMLPLMATAVEMEGMDTTELSAFARDTLTNKLEGTTGVATVNASGMIESQVNVVLDQVKINAANKKLRAAVDSQFADAEEQLDDAESQLEAQLAQLESAKAQLNAAKQGLASGNFGDMGDTTVDASVLGLDEATIDAMLAILEDLTTMELQRQQLIATRDGLQEVKANVDELEASKAALEQQLAAGPQLGGQLPILSAQLAVLDEQNAAYEQMFVNSGWDQTTIDTYKTSDPGYLAMAQGYTDLETTLTTNYSINTAAFRGIVQANQTLTAINASLTAIDASLAQMNLTRAGLGAAIEGMNADIAKLDAAIEGTTAILTQLELGEINAGDALTKAAGQVITGAVGLSEASAQIIAGEAALQSALAQIEQGRAELDNAKEAAQGQADLGKLLTMDMVSNILMAQNFSMPAGYVEQDGVDWLVRVGDEFSSPDELAKLLIMDPGVEGVEPIYLEDVATITLTDNSATTYAKINGKNGLLYTFMKQSTYATADVSDNLNARFAELEEEYPGLTFTNLMDQGDYIYLVINSILQNLVLGALFAIIILFLFLWDLRPTFITLCSIPISVLFAIVLMYFAGVTINILSLSGLAVAVGMLVDNSIVVIENIFRLRNRGESAIRAAISGAAQVTGAIIASTLTTICVFLPIVFVEGITRQLFTDMALTLAFSLIASLIVALTLVPAMSAGMLKKSKPHKSRVIDGVIAFYRRTFKWCMGHRVIVLAASVVLLVASVGLVLVRGFEFMPESASPELMITMEASEESTAADTMEMSDEATRRIGEMEGVETVGAILTGDGMMGMGTLLGMGDTSGEDARTVTMYVKMAEGKTNLGNDVLDAVNGDLLTDLDAEFFAASSSGSMSLDSFGGSGLSVNIYGEDSDDLLESARKVAAVLKGVPGTTNVSDGIGETDNELRFIVDKNKAMAKNLTVAQVFTEVSKQLTTQSNATTISAEDNDYTVRIVNPNDTRLTPAFVRSLQIPYTDFMGEEHTVPLADIAAVEETETARSIERMDQRRYITVTAEVTSDHNVTLVTGEAEQAMQGESLPTTVSYEFTGENQTIMDALRDVGLMLVLGIVLIYLVMVAQFQSLKSPFIVMFTLPLAFTGGFLALLLTGKVLSVVALIGFVMLCGIIVNNGIVLIDYINQLRADGMEKREALLTAGATRLRPILMTSLTTILGLSMMALGIGDGSEMMQPVAIVCIGGLIYATVMTLYIIPILYDFFNRKELKTIDEADLEIIED